MIYYWQWVRGQAIREKDHLTIAPLPSHHAHTDTCGVSQLCPRTWRITCSKTDFSVKERQEEEEEMVVMHSRIAALVVIHHPRRPGFSSGSSAARRSAVSVFPETHRKHWSRPIFFCFLQFLSHYGLSCAAFRPMIHPSKRRTRRTIVTAKVPGEKMRPVNSLQLRFDANRDDDHGRRIFLRDTRLPDRPRTSVASELR